MFVGRQTLHFLLVVSVVTLCLLQASHGRSASLPFEGRSGYLKSVMEALHVPAESQSVVFSKTSLQSHYISPSNPRAIFFSDDVSVAFIPDAPLLEIAVVDPHQGVVFYAI